MVANSISSVAVIGAGNMGHGIAEVVALAGYDVTLQDIDTDALSSGYENIKWSVEKLADSDRLEEPPEAVLERITTTTEQVDAVSTVDLVIEASPENLDLKQSIFTDLEANTTEDTILATNTSSLPITDVASATDSPERVVGMHFFNPPVKMELVEIVHGEETTDETADIAYAFAESLGKTPIYVRKDVRGFVVNSVLEPFVSEPAWMVSKGIATIREADAAMVHQRDYPMGPFELADMTGIDIAYNVWTDAGIEIPPVLDEKFQAGQYGRKTGTGFYKYEDGAGADYDASDGQGFDTLRVEARLVNEAAKLIDEGVATAEDIDVGMILGTGFPVGPCRRGDDIGLDVVVQKLEALQQAENADRFTPADGLRELVAQGHTGRTVGKGFYDHDADASDDQQSAPTTNDRDGSDAAAFGSYENVNANLDDDGLLAVEIDRPDRLNALSSQILADLVDVFSTVDEDAVRCVTIEGAGDDAFCAGADIDGFEELSPTDVTEPEEAFERISSFPCPVIAKINGLCLGGGNELALACDLRIATTTASFGQPEIGLGLLPGGGGTQRLVREIGPARTKELVFRGNTISAARAEDWGLVNRAVDPDEYDDVVDEYVTDLLNGPPVALSTAKRAIDRGKDAPLNTGLTLESQGFGLLLSTDDTTEGVDAFQSNRDPEFEGH